MNIKWKHTVLLVMLMLVSLSACNTSTPAANKPDTATVKATIITTIVPKKAPLTLLADSQNAMKQFKTAHVLQDLSIGSNIFSALTSASSSASSYKIGVIYKNDGDIINPDQSSGKLSMSLFRAGTTVNYSITQLNTNNQVYVQNDKGSWYVLDKTAAGDPNHNPFAIAQFTTLDDIFIAGQQKGDIVDHGIEQLHTSQLRHFTITVGQTATQQLLGGIDPSQTIANIDKSVLDFWIDEHTLYLHRVEMKSILNSSDPAAAASQDNILDMSMEYNNFNQPVTLPTPANPQPITDVNDALK